MSTIAGVVTFEQPVPTTITVAADARLDNRETLMHDLGLQTDASDATIIREAYRRWGTRCAEYLLGDFAAAIWDEQAHALICLRDHFGVRPFYYTHVPGRFFAFASDISTLFAVADIPRRLNVERVAMYLASQLEDTEATLYRDIKRLPPATIMVVSPRAVTRTVYWSLDPSRELRLKSDAEYADAFRATFTEAVRCRLQGTGPVASTLSGGLDSSAVTCVARQLLQGASDQPLHTFSVVFEKVRACDEREYSQAVIDQGGVTAHRVVGDAITPWTDLSQMFAQQGEAFYAPNLFLHVGMYRAARATGARIILDGLDGDTTVSHGLGRFPELLYRGHWLTFIREARAFSKRHGRSLRSVIHRYGIRPGIASRTRRAIRRERQEHLRRLTSGIVPFALEVANHAARAEHLEPRYPFFDRRLAELCLSFPAEQKLSAGWTRLVMRRALEGILPPTVQWRVGKSNLSPNFVHGVAAYDAVALQQLFDRPNIVFEYIDRSTVHAAATQLRRNYGDMDSMVVWKTASLALWLEQVRLAA